MGHIRAPFSRFAGKEANPQTTSVMISLQTTL